ncbi:SDR family oxidoreductase [Luteibacter sp. 3190]|uniref:SDR family NAD(P)-dependent oxidoreductase n=1 Tax=Luteibacter sp. 3190 TaxID=2817736 RepID=UPI002854AF61|nr:SDR family oxidoreductase [Luteibacter sp. 3190]MDR6936658.1 NAD(P)-dependent dehydrogenase (short-subunit alcohol dehydrogenase family) [Luteibacter sp. 3190]
MTPKTTNGALPADGDRKRLAGKTALVTGASRGIGRAIALKLAAEGAQVLVHFSASPDEAGAVVERIAQGGGRASAVRADLGAPDGPRTLATAVRHIVGGRLDILVNNAGISTAATLEEQRMDDFDRMFHVNVRGAYFLVQQLLPVLCAGSVVTFVTSLVARAAIGHLSAYAATKGASDTLVRHLAAALGPRNIRVNAVAPGVVETDMSKFARSDEGRRYTLSMQALQHIAQPGDIADAVVFLASPDARWVTGTTLAVDGGSRL